MLYLSLWRTIAENKEVHTLQSLMKGLQQVAPIGLRLKNINLDISPSNFSSQDCCKTETNKTFQQKITQSPFNFATVGQSKNCFGCLFASSKSLNNLKEKARMKSHGGFSEWNLKGLVGLFTESESSRKYNILCTRATFCLAVPNSKTKMWSNSAWNWFNSTALMWTKTIGVNLVRNQN